MSATNPTLRESMNNGVAMRLADNDRAMCMGDILGRLIAGTTADEIGVNPSLGVPVNTVTLATPPSCVLHVVSTAGAGAPGRLTLLIGVEGVVDPAPGQVVWNGPGSSVLRFNAGDAWTAVNVWYTNADGSDTISLLERTLGQQDR